MCACQLPCGCAESISSCLRAYTAIVAVHSSPPPPPPFQTPALQHWTEYSVVDVAPCVLALGKAQRDYRASPVGVLQAIHEKFSRDEMGSVSTKFQPMAEDRLAAAIRDLSRVPGL